MTGYVVSAKRSRWIRDEHQYDKSNGDPVEQNALAIDQATIQSIQFK